MATIGKIRERSTLLLIVIGGAMVAFVLGDIFSSRGFFANNGAGKVGEVYGEEINITEYQNRVDAEKQSRSSVGQPVNSAMDQQVRDQIWEEMIRERVIGTELEKLGMNLTQQEFDDIRFGENVLPSFKNDQTFQNPETGQFDPQAVQRYFSILQQQYPLFYQVQVQRLTNNRLYEKYNNLLKLGMYVNTLEAKDQYYRQEARASFDFVVKQYKDVADSTVQVTDADMKAFFDKHKHEDRFDLPATVSLEYVVYEVEPTDADVEHAKESVAELIPDFEGTRNDSLFILKYSDIPNPQPVVVTTDDPSVSEAINNAEPGTVIGPYRSGNYYKIAKVAETSMEEQAKSRHILLRKIPDVTFEQLHAKADSIVKVIRAQDNFEEMVLEFSEDPGSKSTGGVYDYFNRDRMVEEFTEASFEKPIGSLNVIETTYGVHIVEPLARREQKVVKALEVAEEIQPSSETFNEVYDRASQLSINASTKEEFEALAKDDGLEVQKAEKVEQGSLTLEGLDYAKDLISWAHDQTVSSVGVVSEPYEFDRNIVVGILTDRRKAGRAELEDVKEDIRPEVVRKKKAEMFINDFKGKTPAEIADQFNLQVQTAMNVTEASPILPGGLNEPYVVGTAFTLQPNTASDPLEGNSGVYVISLKNISEAPAREEYIVYKEDLLEQKQNSLSNINSGVYRALKDMAGVKDNRAAIF